MFEHWIGVALLALIGLAMYTHRLATRLERLEQLERLEACDDKAD